MTFLRTFLATLLIGLAGNLPAAAGTISPSGGAGAWGELTGVPAGFGDGIDNTGGECTVAAVDPVDVTNPCIVGACWVNSVSLGQFTCVATNNWEPNAASSVTDAGVTGKNERDEVDPQWTAHINASDYANVDLFQDAYNQAVSSVTASATNCSTATKANVKVDGTITVAYSDLADAGEDFGDVRVFLPLWKSGALVDDRPTITTDTCNLSPGFLVVDWGDLTVNVDCTGQNATGDRMAVVSVGSGYFSGTSAEIIDGGAQLGWLAGVEIRGWPRVVWTNACTLGWEDAGVFRLRRVPAMNDDANYRSNTTSVGVWLNGNPRTIAPNAPIKCSGSDRDNICLYTQASFGSAIGPVISLNSQAFGVDMGNNGLTMLGEGYSSSGGASPSPFGCVLGNPKQRMPVDTTCAANPACTALNTPFDCCTGGGTGVCCTERSVASTGLRINTETCESYATSNLVVFGLSDSHVTVHNESDPTDKATLFGPGICTQDDFSVCTTDADCPGANTDDCRLFDANQTVDGVFDGLWANGDFGFGPGAQSPSDSTTWDSDARIVLRGTAGAVPTATVATHANSGREFLVGGAPCLSDPNATNCRPGIMVDLSGLRSGTPMNWPGTYDGEFVPQQPVVNAPDCTDVSPVLMQVNSICIDNSGANIGTLYTCHPDDGGTAGICDNAADIDVLGSGAETNSLETLTTGILDDEVPIGSAADDLVYTLLPDCNAAGQSLQYDQATNAFSCLTLNSLATLDTQIGITGTADATTFWRGDNSWAVPGGSGDMVLAAVQTVTGAKTFGAAGAVGKFILAGNTSGTAVLNAAAIAGAGLVHTLPALAGTIIGTGDTGLITEAMLAAAAETGTGTELVTSIAGTHTSTGLVCWDANENAVDCGTGITMSTTGALALPAGGSIDVAAGTAGQCLSVKETSANGGVKRELCAPANFTSGTTITSTMDANGEFDAATLLTDATVTPALIAANSLGRGQIDETLLSSQTHATDCTALTCDAASDGELCFEQDADSFYICDGSGTPAWKAIAAGAGEANTHSSAGGGLALTAATPKVGVDLRLVSLAATDFSVATDVVTVDDDGHAHTSATVSGFLPLAGGTLTGEVVVDDLGLEFGEGDVLIDCTTFATGNGIFYDLSEQKFKKCVNTALTDLDTTGGSPSFDAITGGTNITAAMVVGSGASLTASGTGSNVATGVDAVGAAAIAIGSADVTSISFLSDLVDVSEADLNLLTDGAIAIGSEVSGLGTGVATFLGTPSSANFAAAVTDETGTGAVVLATSPTLTTPVLGAASATSITVTSQTECVMLDASGINCATTTGCATADVAGTNFDFTVADFEGTTDNDEDGAWSFLLPPNLTGTTFSARYIWSTATCTATTNDDVCFGLSAGGVANNEAWNTATLGTAIWLQDTCTTANSLYYSDAMVVTHGWVPNERAVVKIVRDNTTPWTTCTADDVAGDARLHAVEVCYEVDNVFSGE